MYSLKYALAIEIIIPVRILEGMKKYLYKNISFLR